MKSRDLEREQWQRYFDGFSRTHRGRPVTVESMGTEVGLQTIARQLPLVGITADSSSGSDMVIEIIVGDSPDAHLTHVVHHPSQVRIAQAHDGADDIVLIESADEPATLVDVSEMGSSAWDEYVTGKMGTAP